MAAFLGKIISRQCAVHHAVVEMKLILMVATRFLEYPLNPCTGLFFENELRGYTLLVFKMVYLVLLLPKKYKKTK